MHNIKQDKPRGLFSYKAPRNVTLILNTALPNAYIFHDFRPLSPRKIPVYFVVFLCFFGTKIIACFKAFFITKKNTFTIRIVNVKHYVYSIVLAVKLWERKKNGDWQKRIIHCISLLRRTEITQLFELSQKISLYTF